MQIDNRKEGCGSSSILLKRDKVRILYASHCRPWKLNERKKSVVGRQRKRGGRETTHNTQDHHNTMPTVHFSYPQCRRGKEMIKTEIKYEEKEIDLCRALLGFLLS